MKNFVAFKEGNVVLSVDDLRRMVDDGSLSTTITRLCEFADFFAANAIGNLNIT